MITRDDCFAVQNSDGTYRKTERPLTTDEILKHLSGDHTIGIYQIDDRNEVKFLCLDIDLRKEVLTDGSPSDEQHAELQKVATNLIRAAESLGLQPVPEFSGRRGYHLLFFFDRPVSASAARGIAERIKQCAEAIPADIEVEVFPKQDHRTAYGSLLKLPLGVHRLSGKRSTFVSPDSWQPISNAIDVLRNATPVRTKMVDELTFSLESTKTVAKKTGAALLDLNRPGLEQMVKNCPVIQLFEVHPERFAYDAWLGVGSNYIVFKGGWERFVQISKRDAANFSQHEIDRIRDEILDHFHGPQTYDVFMKQGVVFDLHKGSPNAPAGYGSRRDPIQSNIVEQDGCYGRLGKEGAFEMLTPFTIETKELLLLPDGDVLTCTINHRSGQSWDDVRIENVDWHTRSKFMKALGHSECTFHGSDLQLIDVCQHVVSQVNHRKQGTRIIGLQNDLWVTKNINISAAGYIDPLTIIPYDRSADSLHTRVQYQHLDDTAYTALASGFFGSILTVNLPEVILPILGWFFAAPLKPRIMEVAGSFPILFCYGTAGGGKTSLLELMLTLQGYVDPTVYSCTMKPFPMLKLLCSTNAVPIVLDEFKPWDMRDFQVLDIGRLIRKIYRGEIEDKGTGDQGVIHYHLQAPVVVCGESKVNQTAVMERVLVAGFTDAIKNRPDMQQAFRSLRQLDLTAFMDRYIQFCLNADVEVGLAAAEAKMRTLLAGTSIQPRPAANLAAMVFGLDLMQQFAMQWGVDLSGRIDLKAALKIQLEEIAGNDSGQVKLAADMLLEQLAIMVEKNLLTKYVDFSHVIPTGSDPKHPVLALHLKTAVQTFKANLRHLGFDGEVLDDAAYLKQFKTRDYVKATNHTVRFPYLGPSREEDKIKKCLLIDVDKAKTMGLELTGFDGTELIGADDQVKKPLKEDSVTDHPAL